MNTKRHISGFAVGSNNAFTLVEIMTVVAIIGVIAAIAIPSFISARDRAHVTAAISDLRAFEQALTAYNLEEGAYPRMSVVPPLVTWLPAGTFPEPLRGYSQEKDWTGTTPCGGKYLFSDSPYPLGAGRGSRYYVKISDGKPALLRSLATELNGSTATNCSGKALYVDGEIELLYFVTLEE
jgi:general secretion pathway protein G